MDDEHEPEERPRGSLSGWIIGLVIALALMVGGVIAMVAPSGDRSGTGDEGLSVQFLSPSPAAGSVRDIKVAAKASLATSGGVGALQCLFTFRPLPNDPTTVVRVLVTGRGTGPVPFLHPGQEAIGDATRPSSFPANEIRVTQTIPDVSGPYTCRVTAVTTEAGSVTLTGDVAAKASG